MSEDIRSQIRKELIKKLKFREKSKKLKPATLSQQEGHSVRLSSNTHEKSEDAKVVIN